MLERAPLHHHPPQMVGPRSTRLQMPMLGPLLPQRPPMLGPLPLL